MESKEDGLEGIMYGGKNSREEAISVQRTDDKGLLWGSVWEEKEGI